MSEEQQDIRHAFDEVVNMTASELRSWLDTEASKEVGQKEDGHDESTGHESGRRILAILGTQKADLTTDDEAHMHTVVGYVKRHLAQRPDGDVHASRWRYSRMTWGHDPEK